MHSKLFALFTVIGLGSLAVGDIHDDTPEIVEFHIAPGTANKPWNTRQTTVKVKLGQVLRILNDDSIPHTLHTFDRPCPHQPVESQTGEFYDCVIATTVDPNIDLLYEHTAGVLARFYLETVR